MMSLKYYTVVRGMIDTDGSTSMVSANKTPRDPGGVVVQGQGNTSYVGGTHFMAMLEDVSSFPYFFPPPFHVHWKLNLV